MATLREIEAGLAGHGLSVLGLAAAGRRVLVGNAGSGMWHAFRAEPECRDGAPDPLDRWSRRIGERLAAELGAAAVFPFDGPPYPPFLAWAAESGQAFPSPISMFIHARHGLWHAYRFALEFKQAVTVNGKQPEPESPCLQCTVRPCLDACPVAAFTDGEYRVADCTDHLRGADRGGCMERGCAARRACPVAPGNRYDVGTHAAFHMRAFLRRST